LYPPQANYRNRTLSLFVTDGRVLETNRDGLRANSRCPGLRLGISLIAFTLLMHESTHS